MMMNLSSSQGARPASPRVAYVVKRYPRFSETFIVQEILAHEAAGRAVEILSLYAPNDTHFQDLISRVRSPVTYLPADGLRGSDLWGGLGDAARKLPGFWRRLEAAEGANAREVFQGAWLARLVREKGIRHLHAHFATTAATVARLAAEFAGIPFTFTAHAKDIFHEDVDEQALRRNLAAASAVVTVSDFNVAHLCGRFDAEPTRVHRIYNGLPLDQFPLAEAPRDRNRVVAVGRLIEKKGFGVLIDAVQRLHAVGRKVVCDIVGTGELEGALRGQIERLGLGSSVRLLGALPQAEVIRQVRGAAVFAAPCVVGRDGNADGLPTVLLEAMALGTPCLSTDVTGIPEILEHGVTGWQVAQHDSAGLAEGLSRLLDDESLCSRLAAKARVRIEEDFNGHRNAAALWRLFERSWRDDGEGRGVAPSEERRVAARGFEVVAG